VTTFPITLPHIPDGYKNGAALDTYIITPINDLYALLLRPAVSRLEDSDGSSVPDSTGTALGSYNLGETYVNDPLAVLSHASGTQTLGKVGRWRWTLTVTWTLMAGGGTIPAHHRGLYVYLNGSVVANAAGSRTDVFPSTTAGWPAQNVSTTGTVITTATTDTLQAVVYQNTGVGRSIDSAVFEVELVP
jgi:hypothetical protein